MNFGIIGWQNRQKVSGQGAIEATEEGKIYADQQLNDSENLHNYDHGKQSFVNFNCLSGVFDNETFRGRSILRTDSNHCINIIVDCFRPA